MSGCGVFTLNGFIIPDDLEFTTIVVSLDTPEKISNYMVGNFTYETHLFYAPDPYILWKTGKGDCNDFATFVQFVCNYHGYETWVMKLKWQGEFFTHHIPIIRENDLYRFFDNMNLIGGNYINFRDIANADAFYQGRIWVKYKVYDYENNLMELGDFKIGE